MNAYHKHLCLLFAVAAASSFCESDLETSLIQLQKFGPAPPPAVKPIPCKNASSWPWCNPMKPLEKRVELLLQEIHNTELAGLLDNNIFDGTQGIERLDVPVYNFVTENSHGLTIQSVDPVPTVLPHVIGLASSFNRSLFTAVGNYTGGIARNFYEAGYTPSWDTSRTEYLQGIVLQNNINIFRDPRWGRGQETPGEDPYLNGVYETSWLEGIKYPRGPGGVPQAAGSCKHFAAYSFEGGPTLLNMTTHLRQFVPGYSTISRHNFDAQVSRQDFIDTYQPAFEACVKAGARGSMCSVNAVNGVPMCGNKDLEDELMRKAWGFDGVILTDCDSVADMYYPQKTNPTETGSVLQALEATTDVFCSPGWMAENTNSSMYELMRSAVKRVLTVRFELGEFNPPDPDYKPGHVDPAYSTALALEIGVESAVLLKNDASTLPLAKSSKVMLLGPFRNATWELAGSYAPDKDVIEASMVSPLEGFTQFSEASIITPDQGMSDACSDTTSISASPPGVDFDAVIVVGGIYGNDYSVSDPDLRPSESVWCQKGCLEGEGCDRPDISWPAGQKSLIENAAAWGKPVILVIIGGGAMDMEGLKDLPNLRSILWMGYPGTQGGNAMASLIYGDSTPSGRLSQTFYKGNFTAWASMTDMRMRPGVAAGSQQFDLGTEKPFPGRTYRFTDPSFVTYPFGFGLSYQRFELTKSSRVSLLEAARPCTTLVHSGTFRCSTSVSVSLAAGEKPGALALLLFLSPPAETLPWAPRKSLRSFEKVLLQPGGAAQEVSLALTQEDFMLTDSWGNTKLATGSWTGEISGGTPELAVGLKLEVTEASCTVQ